MIREQITRRGRITFAEYMELALYSPELGYYTSAHPVIAAEGDFFTSPVTHPVFAALLTRQLEQMWRLLGRPADFQIIETGAGNRLLARDITGYLPRLSPAFSRAARYFTVERERVTAYSEELEKPAALPDDVCGCFLSNELLDALPTHRVVMRDGALREAYVILNNGEFAETWDEPSTPALADYLAGENITLAEGQQAEINLNIGPYFEDIARRLRRGYVITIDYGYPAAELYTAERRSGTLMTYYHHMPGGNPYAHIGAQDITSHVDFTAAVLSGERHGLNCRVLLTQREFLLNLGFHEYIDGLAGMGLSNPEYLANRYAMLELVREEGMGGFRVLLQSREAPAIPLYGKVPEKKSQTRKAAKSSLPVPLLDREHLPLFLGKYPQYQGISDDVWQ
ncbi:MAG: SAM-dependent methyltransferase [Chloroflexota bacterium]